MPKETFFNLPLEKQEKVMRASIEEFLKLGFEKANIGTIAKNAGVAKGSIYQYFENKNELFSFSVKWSIDLIMNKYDKYMSNDNNKSINMFDYFYQNAKDIWTQLTEEKEIIIFLQDVFLGKYKGVNDEAMDLLMKISDELVLQQIREGKKNGYIRKDIDDNILSLFMTGVSLKIKEYIMNKARTSGTDMVNQEFEKIEDDIKAMIELLKNGMEA